MFNKFFTKTDKVVSDVINDIMDVQPVVKKQTTNEIIEEIHETFFTEVDRLLAEAGIKNDVSTDKQALIDKSERLKALGFKNTGQVNEAEQEKKRLALLKDQNNEKDRLIRAINYFKLKYPLYKFITEESVKKICEKYNLVYSEAHRYIGDVPIKNLEEIEKFAINPEDKAWLKTTTYYGGMSTSDTYKIMSKSDVEFEKEDPYARKHGNFHFSYNYNECTLEIAAPLKDFDLKDTELKGFKLSKKFIPDPVVLQPVIFEGEKHYLVVTAWGEEAGDDLVRNEIYN